MTRIRGPTKAYEQRLDSRANRRLSPEAYDLGSGSSTMNIIHSIGAVSAQREPRLQTRRIGLVGIVGKISIASAARAIT